MSTSSTDAVVSNSPPVSPSSGLAATMDRCSTLIHAAKHRNDPRYKPVIKRYHEMMQSIGPQRIENFGPKMLEDMEELSREVERMLDEVVKTSTEGKEEKKKRESYMCM
jgi:hypothetical protein